MNPPKHDLDVLGYDPVYGWVVCCYLPTRQMWVHGWEGILEDAGNPLPEFKPIMWVELPEGCNLEENTIDG